MSEIDARRETREASEGNGAETGGQTRDEDAARQSPAKTAQTEESFQVALPVVTAWEDESGQMRFLGVASSTRLDRQGDQMTAGALRRMAAMTALPLLTSHHAGHDQALGLVETGWTDGHSLRVAGTLHPDNPAAWALVKSLQAGRAYGLSVGGRILRASRGEDPLAGPVRFIEDVELDHIALCEPEEAANPDAAVESGEWGVESDGAEAETGGQTRVEDDARQSPGGDDAEMEESSATEEAGEADLVTLVAELRQEVAALRKELQGEEAGAEEVSYSPATPGGTSPAPTGDGDDGETADREETAGDVAPALQTEAEPGRRQSLPLGGAGARSRKSTESTNLWKGVL